MGLSSARKAISFQGRPACVPGGPAQKRSRGLIASCCSVSSMAASPEGGDLGEPGFANELLIASTDEREDKSCDGNSGRDHRESCQKRQFCRLDFDGGYLIGDLLRLVPDGRYLSGDLLLLNPDGAFQFVGLLRVVLCSGFQRGDLPLLTFDDTFQPGGVFRVVSCSGFQRGDLHLLTFDDSFQPGNLFCMVISSGFQRGD